MPKAQVEQIFKLSARALWNLIGDFGDMGKWSGRPPDACLQEGEGIGCLRTLTIRDGAVIVDRLEAQTEFSYTYSIVSSPLPFKSYQATMAVEAINDSSSKFTWSGEFEPQGISDEESIKFATNMYQMGIGLMKDTIDKMS